VRYRRDDKSDALDIQKQNLYDGWRPLNGAHAFRRSFLVDAIARYNGDTIGFFSCGRSLTKWFYA
jgi:hypothetical protein